MILNDTVLWDSEKVIYKLRALYLENGYTPFRMSKFEEYDLYAGNKDFLVSDNVITFTDTNGRLMALKPDVTLSIIKNSIDDPKVTSKVFYNENVYRASKDTGSFSEIRQTGVECFGNVGVSENIEVLSLSLKSLRSFSDSFVIAVSDIGIVKELIERLGLSKKEEKSLFAAIGSRNLSEMDAICENSDDKNTAALLKALVNLSGSLPEELTKMAELLEPAGVSSYRRFAEVMKALAVSENEGHLVIDFSVTADTNYYNGIVFKGFIAGVPTPVLLGGQYDNLMKRLGRKSAAIGFAVYTDSLSISEEENTAKRDDGYLNVALPKGRLGEKVYAFFEKAGYECPKLLDPGRQLIFENPEKKVRYFWVKPSDVAIYVERGAADLGVAGKDIILEYEPDVYELVDLKKGKCRMAVAAPEGFTDDPGRTLKVATKFSNIAASYYRKCGRDIDIIHLNGSIEIAPILGLSDVIVDIVETGTTLKENNLRVYDTVVPISARLIANKASYKFKNKQIDAIASKIREIVEEEE